MLAAGAAETGEHIVGDVVAALHRDLLDRIGHIAHRDGDESFGHGFRCGPFTRRRADFVRQRVETAAHGGHVQRFIAARAEEAREIIGLHLAEHDVAVGDRERAAAPVAGRAGIGAGAVRPHTIAAAVEVQDRTAASGHGVDAHHRRAHAHAGNLGFEHPLELAREVRDVGGRAAHVEADHALEAGLPARAHHADDAAGGAGQDAVLALERACIGQAAIGLHELQIHAGQFVGHLVDVAAQDRRQVGVDNRGVATRDKLHHRAHFVRDRHLREADRARDAGHRRFMRRVAIAMHEHDGQRAQAGVERRLQAGAGGCFIERLHDVAMRADAFIDLDHLRVQQLGQHDVAIEQAGPVLVGDAQRVAVAARDGQHGRLALALEQRIGGHGRAHLDGLDAGCRQRRTCRDAQQVTDAGNRCVAVLFGVLGQELVRDELPIRAAPHDIGECAATVDPELPIHTHSLC